jgi:hypothetical protein
MGHFGRFVMALAFGLILATAGAAVYVLRAATTIPPSDVVPAVQAHATAEQMRTTAKQVRTTANPAAPGTPGGGSGGAICTDCDNYNVLISKESA